MAKNFNEILNSLPPDRLKRIKAKALRFNAAIKKARKLKRPWAKS